MAISTKKLRRKNISERELPKKKHQLRDSIHVFKQSKIPMSVEVAKKAHKIFNLTA